MNAIHAESITNEYTIYKFGVLVSFFLPIFISSGYLNGGLGSLGTTFGSLFRWYQRVATCKTGFANLLFGPTTSVRNLQPGIGQND